MLIGALTVTPKRVAAGGLVHVYVETRAGTAAGALTNPGTSIKFGFYDPSGDLTALATMTTGSTGTHTLAIQTATTSEPGERRPYVQAVHTDGTSELITKHGDERNFEVY